MRLATEGLTVHINRFKLFKEGLSPSRRKIKRWERMLSLNNISKSYKSKAFVQRALENINLVLPSTGIIFITGKSGSGKSTLLNILGGIDHPDSGEIYFRNKLLDFSKPKIADHYRRNEVSFIFQKFNLMEKQTIYDNIEISGAIQGQKADPEQISKIIDSVDLKGLALKKANEISVGQAQRVAIARALYKKARIILADEPTGNLDSQNAKSVLELLKRESKNTLVIVATHDIEAAKAYGNRIIELKDGKIINDQSIERSFKNTNLDFEPSHKKISFLYILKTAFSFLSERKVKSLLAFVLSLMSVIFFGISLVSILINPINVAIKSLKENSIDYVYLENIKDGINYVEGKYNGEEFVPLYKSYNNEHIKDVFRLPLANYTAEISDFEKFGLDLILGSFPQTYTEIAITDYLAEKMIMENSDFSSIDQLIGKTPVFSIAGLENNLELDITGIIKTDYEYRMGGYEAVGDYLYSHYYVKKGFMEHYLNNIIYGNGGFIIEHQSKRINETMVFVNDRVPVITTIKNPLLSDDDIRIVTEDGFVQAEALELANDEIIINLNYYNYLFRTEGNYLTPENIEDLAPVFNHTVQFFYFDRYAISSSNKNYSLKIKGLIFDTANEPVTAQNIEYNYAAFCIIVSDELLHNLTQLYHSPVKYLLKLSSPNIKEIFKKHYPLANSNSSSDTITTPLDSFLEAFISKLNQMEDIFITMGVIFTFFSLLLIYHNINNNIDKNKYNIGILRALGFSKRHIIFIFILENLISIIFILPLSFFGINYIMKKLNEHFIISGFNIKLLNFSFINIPPIIIYTILVYFCSTIIPLRFLLSRTPTEIIRRR